MSTPFSSYPDWVRVTAFDQVPLDWSDLNAVYVGGTATYGPFDCTNWARVAGSIVNNAAHELDVTWFWSADSAGTQGIAQRQLYLGPTSIPAAFNHANLGPWLTVTAQAVTGSLQLTTYGFRTQRVAPTPYVAAVPYFFPPGNQTVPGSGSLETFCLYPWAGPVGWRLSTAGNPGTIQFKSYNGADGRVVFSQQTVAANSENDGQIDFPEASCTVQINNGAAGSAIFAVEVFPIVTGSR